MSWLLHTCCLLVMQLTLSWSSLEALPPPQTLCGSHLLDALYLICGADPKLGLEMGVSQHDYHQLLWYKGRGFPQYCLIVNSSKQLYQRSILSTFCSHLQVSSPLLLSMSRLLHAGCLMVVLLALSWSSLEALPPPQLLCGSHLVDALYLVCGDRGFFYNSKRDVDPMLGADQTERGITSDDLCCRKPCTVYDIQNYCN
ncbi:Insulin [Merluccius polli]|uniref:Insulin n=1 Tax=Merluccius polli TaxID=89951 RepID=A0AA47M6P5_MERPO|nr:Insulin [Merluccius polli]